MEKNDLVLDIRDLVVHYETEDADVHAVNGIDIQVGKRIWFPILPAKSRAVKSTWTARTC